MPLWALPAVAFVGALVAALSELASGWRKSVLLTLGILIAAAGSTLSFFDLRDGQSSVERLSGQLAVANTVLEELRGQSGRLERDLDIASAQLQESSEALARRGVEIANLQTDLDAAREELASFEVPILRVTTPEISIACEDCDDVLEIVNTGGTIGAVINVDFLSVATITPLADQAPFLAPQQHHDTDRACPFPRIPFDAGDEYIERVTRTFDFRAVTANGVRYPHEQAVPRSGVAGEIHLGRMLSSVHSFREDLARAYLQKRAAEGLPALPEWLVDACIDLHIRVSIQIDFTSRGGDRNQRTFVYGLSDRNGNWTLYPDGGDVGGLHFGRSSDPHPLTTHNGMAEAASDTRTLERSRIIDDLASFLMTRHLR